MYAGKQKKLRDPAQEIEHRTAVKETEFQEYPEIRKLIHSG
jgi:hypothetical protein